MLKREAKEITGGLNKVTKMPCDSYNLPPQECKAGSKLAKVPGTVCNKCYAMKGLYAKYRNNIQPAQYRHLEAIKDPQWVDAMVTLIKGKPFFRWHDAGDLQGVKHLEKICAIARLTPETKHWLPTREYNLVTNYKGDIPGNLKIRISAQKIDGPAPKSDKFTVSSVYWKGAPAKGAHVCPAPKQNGECGECRVCWTDAPHVAYKFH